MSLGTVQAQDTGVVYAGGSAGDGINGYAGGVVALPGSRLGHGFAVRADVNGGDYRYDANGQEISARYFGSDVALVYQTSGKWGWANFSVGPRVTDTRISPIDPANRLRGTRVDVGLQTDGTVGDEWCASWFVSLGVIDLAYITQVRGSRLVDRRSNTQLGLEGGVQGDRHYNRRNVGVFASTRISGKFQGVLSAGGSKQRDRPAKPYVSIGLSRVF